MAFLSVSGLSRSYTVAGQRLDVLREVSLEVADGEMVAIVGASGVGKSTLLHLIGGLDRPDAGQITVGGVELTALADQALVAYRNSRVGFVFQFHHLLPAFTALENVTLPALMTEGFVSEAQRAHARELLAAVGLAHAEHKRPAELSGGMQQRVAIARAVALKPALVLADEPTGNLDQASSSDVFSLLRQIHAEQGTTFLIVTHDPRLASRCDRLVEIVDGRIERDEPIGAAAG